jgi:hypothetical protein
MTRGSLVIRRVVWIGAALALVAPLAAQQPQQQAPEENEQQLRYQVQTFEAVLQSAVRHGGETFARLQAGLLPPAIQLTSDDPQARGFALPQGGGLLFVVVVPGLQATVNYFLALRGMQGYRPVAGVGGRGGSLAAAGVAAPDPMTKSPEVDDGRCASRKARSSGTPISDYEYAVSVCDALMDAMLDNSGPLPVKDDEWLTVAVIAGVGMTPPGVVNDPSNYTTYLAIKGTDLAALRQGKITKDEARKLVSFTRR